MKKAISFVVNHKFLWIGRGKAIVSFIIHHPLIWIGLLINISYYISAYQTHWFDYFFSGSSLHLCCKGLDFYAVPDGIYSYLHGGNLGGGFDPNGPHFAPGNRFGFINANWYHPLFTFLIGSLLIRFEPTLSFNMWMFAKFFLTLGMATYFYIEFRGRKYTDFAIFLIFASFTQYDEIRIAQYQGMFNFFAFFLLIRLVKGKDTPIITGVLYFLTLFAKPISALWLPVLVFKGYARSVIIALLLFAGITIPFLINHLGDYYVPYLLDYITHPDTSGPIQIITLDTLLRYSTPIPSTMLSLLKLFFWVFTIFVSSFKRVHILKGIYLSALYFLLFYGHIYEYYYTILIGIFAVAIVACPDFQKIPALLLIVLASCPNIFFALHYFHVGFVEEVWGPDPTVFGWQLIVLSKIVPLILLMIFIVGLDIKIIFYDFKKFMRELRLVNRKLETFG